MMIAAFVLSALAIDTGRQLFVDDFLVASTNGVVRHWNSPVKAEGPVLRPTSEADGRSAGCTVATSGGLWWDPTIGKYRLWYETDWAGQLRYAESSDGLVWELPDLGTVRGTNRVFDDAENPLGKSLDSWSVFPDYKAENPYASWKMLVSAPGGSTADTLYESADGRVFRRLGVAGYSGDRTTMYFDAILGKWVFSLRSYHAPLGRARRIALQDEFKPSDRPWCWDTNVAKRVGATAVPDKWKELDRLGYGRGESLYSFDAVPYESLTLGVAEILHNTPRDNLDSEERGLPKQTALRFAFSRDGRTFTASPTEAIRPSGWGSGKWDTGYLSAIGGICTVSDESLRFYYSALRGDAELRREKVGRPPMHRQGLYFNGAIGYATLRRDGFCGFVADGNGEIVTKPVTFLGSNLFVNAECLYGEVAAEVLDECGRPVEGFAVADCRAMRFADSTKRVLRFRGGNLGRFAGRAVSFRFVLHCATLYSFWVSSSERGESNGYVAAGGPRYRGLRDVVPSAPRGTEWQDCRTFGEGRLPPRAWFGHFPDAESARAVRPERSPWQISLDSETAWRFRWSRRPEERPVGFFRPDYDVSGWDVVKVPCSWQAMGIRASGERFGTPIYVNHPYIFTPRFPANVDCPPCVVGNDLPADWTFGSKDNPIGSYRREFEIPSDWSDSQVVIRFDGVESFYYLWVNGHYLGFAKNSRGASEFDVTDFVRPGTNTVALEVYRNSDGSYLECQDIYRLSGILRSVSVHRRPKTHLEDVRIVTRPWTPGVYEGDWSLELDVTKTGPDVAEVGVEVFDAQGGKVPFAGDVRLGRSVLRFARPRTWTAETPNLHTLVVTLARNGKVLEAAGFDLGFCEVAIRDDGVQSNRVFTVNGSPVKLKGVNRGETDPMYGHYVPDTRIEQDIRLIKEGNFNHIRCSHMPQPPYFYYLCDRYGIYVMDEANLETHGLYYGKESLSNRPEWKEAHVDRQRAMYCWNKNYPCIVYWSLGNEAGPGDNFKACAEYLRRADGTRPVQYERNNWVGDSGACMYPSLELVEQIASAADRRDPISPDKPIRYPYYLLEYAHSFNNNCGNLADYQALIESSDRMMGGSIWDWADQSLWKRMPDGRIVQTWGGCFGEKPEGGQGIMDGIVTTDRRPDPNYYEAKHVFQSFTATLADGKIRIRNKNHFRDSSGYDCRWTLLVNGEPAGTGILAVSVGPQESADIPLPEEVRAAVGKGTDEVALRVQFALRNAETVLPKGWIVAEDQLELVPPRKPRPLRTGGERPTVVKDDSESLSIRSGDLVYAFSKATGELVSLKRGTHELLKSPMTIDCFRVPVGGESHCFRTNTFGLARLRDGLRKMKPTLASLSTVRKESDGALSLTCVVRYRGTRKEDAPWYCHGDGGKIADCGPVDADAPGVEATSEWRFCGAEGVAFRTTFRPFGRPTEFSRMGWRFVFDEPETAVRYFALGPHDNYPDRRTCCFAAVHSAASTAFGFRYGVNQDNGTRGEARWVELARPGVRFDAAGNRLFSFAVTPYSPTELMENAHPELNPTPVKTELGLYAKVRGLGSGNCGPEPLEKDRIAAGETCILAVTVR